MLIFVGCSPRCPQVPVDVGHLLRIPDKYELPVEPEDEFECLNLDVAIPKSLLSAGQKLPIMIWIHGMFASTTAQQATVMLTPAQEDHRP